MKIAITIVAGFIGILSIAAGAAKIALVPEEVEFLGQFGFTTVLTMSFGFVQVLSGLLLMMPITRFYGSLMAAIAFALSSVLLLITGDTAFAGVSLVPVILAGFIAYKCFSARPTIAPGENDA